jgi:hypothetical protein
MMLLNQQTSSSKNCHEMLNRLKSIFKSYSPQKQTELSDLKAFIDDVENIQRGGESSLASRKMYPEVQET